MSSVKGKGKGLGGPPAPPKAPPAGSPPKAKAKGFAAKPLKEGEAGGMAALLKRVEATGKQMDENNALDIADIDLSGIDPNAKGETIKCPRCELDILVSLYEDHKSSHSSEILPWLFLGGKRNLDNGKELTERTHITHILNVAHEVSQDPVAKEEWLVYNKEKGCPSEYQKYHWTDTKDQDIISEMSGPCEFIHQAHMVETHHVLVHCVQGISRSASVVIFYLMKHCDMSLREAFEHVKARRDVIQPRAEFLDQLGDYECRTRKLTSPTLTSAEVYKGKTVLDVDAPLLAKVENQPVADPKAPEDCSIGAYVEILQGNSAGAYGIVSKVTEDGPLRRWRVELLGGRAAWTDSVCKARGDPPKELLTSSSSQSQKPVAVPKVKTLQVPGQLKAQKAPSPRASVAPVFAEGSKVRAVGGKYDGQAGTVVKVAVVLKGIGEGRDMRWRVQLDNGGPMTWVDEVRAC